MNEKKRRFSEPPFFYFVNFAAIASYTVVLSGMLPSVVSRYTIGIDVPLKNSSIMGAYSEFTSRESTMATSYLGLKGSFSI